MAYIWAHHFHFEIRLACENLHFEEPKFIVDVIEFIDYSSEMFIFLEDN